MEQTIGKRIAACRKRMGLTQEALAEQLGVTAQAVSKWENDQSCPDITMLPKLAKVFGITTDEILGIEREKVYEAQVVGSDEDPDGDSIVIGEDGWKMSWDAGRKGTLGMAVWILLVGGLLLTSNILGWGATFWGVLWPTALLVIGLFGLWPKFSFLRAGIALLGGYFTLNNIGIVSFDLDRSILLPILLVLFGLNLLGDALKKKKKGGFHFVNNGRSKEKSSYTATEDMFDCSVSFAEREQSVLLPKLTYGKAQVSFGELELDLTGCDSFADGCELDISCSFGEVEVRVPRNVEVDLKASSSLGSVEVEGAPDGDARQKLAVTGNVSFGEIVVCYV